MLPQDKTERGRPKALREMEHDELLRYAELMLEILGVSFTDQEPYTPTRPSVRVKAWRYGAKSTDESRQLMLMVLDRMMAMAPVGGLGRVGEPPESFE